MHSLWLLREPSSSVRGWGPREGGGAGAAWQLSGFPVSVGWGRLFPSSPPAPREPDSPRRGGQSKQGPQSLSEPTAEDPFRFRLAGFGFVSSSSWNRWEGSPAGTSAAPFLLYPMLPVPLCTGGGLTEALLEPDSSSALGGCVAFFRLRGLDRAAFRRLLGGLVDESS